MTTIERRYTASEISYIIERGSLSIRLSQAGRYFVEMDSRRHGMKVEISGPFDTRDEARDEIRRLIELPSARSILGS